MTFQEITHPDDLATDLRHLEELLTGQIEAYQMEKRYIHKRGHSSGSISASRRSVARMGGRFTRSA